MKRILLLTFLLIFALNSLAFAAKSSSRPSSPSRPSTSTPAAKTAPAQEMPNSGYKPSAPVNSYSDKAPAVKPPAPPQAAQSGGSSWLRNAGMIAGGMMLGGMLSNMFGHGNSGWLADILGVLISVIPFIALFMLGRFLWIRHKEKQQAQTSNRY